MADTYIAKLGYRVDTKELKKGDKALEDLTKSGKGAEKGIKSLSTEAKAAGIVIAGTTTAITAATAAIGAYVYSLGDAERQLRASALMANLSTGDFEKLTYVYKQFGVTVDQASDIFKDSREKIGQWLTDQTGGFEDFGNVMGMTTEQLTTYAKEVEGLTGQQLLQRLVSDMEDAGVSASQMSFALEGLASEATRMIPALSDNGKAVRALERDYDAFNAALALDEKEIENYSKLNQEFDLLFDTIGNRATKVMAPFAKILSEMARDVTEMISGGSLESQLTAASGNVESIDKKLISLNQTLKKQQSTDKSSLGSAYAFKALNDQIDKTKSQIDELTKSRSEYADEMERLQKLIDSTKKASVNNGSIATDGLFDFNSFDADRFAPTLGSLGDEWMSNGIFASESVSQRDDYDRWLDSVVESTVTASEKIQKEIKKIQDAVKSGNLDKATGDLAIANLESQLPNPFESFTKGAIDALAAVQSLSEQGSKEWKELGAAINSVTAGMDIAAAIGSSSIGNITGAITSGFAAIESISSIFGEIETSFQQRQEEQGRNQWGEYSESINNSVEITANATEKLVGINTNMLKAMQKVQSGILSASGIISKGNVTPTATPGDVIQGGFGMDALTSLDSGVTIGSGIGSIAGAFLGPLGSILGGVLGGAIGGLLGGSSKVSDEGIQIVGGAITDLIEETVVQGYQEVKSKKWKWSSTKTNTAFTDLGDEVGNQFSLVFGSIVDAVGTAAETLGLSTSEINAALEAFEVETTKISTMGLSLDEQTEAINNYFSDVFNDLSISVVPFLDKFQKTGEELGETLARLATEVSIFDILIQDLGVSMSTKELNPEAFATAADNLATLTGGVESFAEKTGSFINNFADDATKISIYEDALNESLSDVGLSLPETSEAMWDLMRSLDASTKAGQEQIATLLNIQETAAEYYKLLDKENKEREKQADSYRGFIDSMYDVSDAVAQMSLDAALAAARMGDFSLAEDLNLNSVSPSKQDFSTMLEYELARAETAAKIEELARLTESNIPFDEQQLDTLKQIEENTNIQTDNTMQIKAMSNQIFELTSIQEGQARHIADSNALLQQMVIDGIPVRVE